MSNSSFFDHFDTHFSTLPDPRLDRNKRQSLKDILLLTLLAVIGGAESWTKIELFGKSRQESLKAILSLPNGVPSHDTLGRVFSLLNPKRLEASFLSWIRSLVTLSAGALIAIEGKTLRRSHDRASGVNAIHLVSAWASENAVVPGQVKTDQKSNEIIAIPQWLAQLQLQGGTVSIEPWAVRKR